MQKLWFMINDNMKNNENFGNKEDFKKYDDYVNNCIYYCCYNIIILW